MAASLWATPLLLLTLTLQPQQLGTANTHPQTPPPLNQQQPTNQPPSTRFYLEYYENTYIDVRFNLHSYPTDPNLQQYLVGNNSLAGSGQICKTVRTCTTTETPDTNSNYYNGTRFHNISYGVIKGGYLTPQEGTIWLTKHPTTTRQDGVVAFLQITGDTQTVDNGGPYNTAFRKIPAYNYREIGFQANTPTIQPQPSPNQYQISWPNPIRYTPNHIGYIVTTTAKGIEDKTTYWIQTDSNQNFTSPQETEIGPTELTVNNDRYQATITHLHPPNTQIWARVRYQETRFEVVYDIYSPPTSLTTPANATQTTQPPTTTPTTSGGGNTPTTPLTQPSPTSSPATQPQPTPSTQPTPTGGGNSPNNPTGGLGIQPSSSGGENPDQAPIPEFIDTIGHTHEQNIGQLADKGVTRGCNPPENSRFCPDRAVTRGEMATFLVRAFELSTTNEDPFTDTQDNVHRPNISRMAAAGISRGCNPPENSRFCPERAVTRAEMATFMTRVLELDETGNTDFGDTTGNIHSTNIQRFANAGITRGCNPPTNTRYCPDRAVTRAEMATFLIRSTNLNNS